MNSNEISEIGNEKTIYCPSIKSLALAACIAITVVAVMAFVYTFLVTGSIGIFQTADARNNGNINIHSNSGSNALGGNVNLQANTGSNALGGNVNLQANTGSNALGR